METLELNVDGMGCGSCVKKVRQALSEVPGVLVGDVTIGRAVVQYDPATASESAILAALARKHYPATKAATGPVATATAGGADGDDHCRV